MTLIIIWLRLVADLLILCIERCVPLRSSSLWVISSLICNIVLYAFIIFRLYILYLLFTLLLPKALYKNDNII